MTYSSSLLKNSSRALPSRIAERELPTKAGKHRNTGLLVLFIDWASLWRCPCMPFYNCIHVLNLYQSSGWEKWIRSWNINCTIEFGPGQDASTNRKPILPIADIKGRDGWMVRHLAEDTERERNLSSRARQKKIVRYPLALINFTLAAFHRCLLSVFVKLCKIFHTRHESCPVLVRHLATSLI